MLNKWLLLMPVLLGGLVLGLFYFGGLWFTVQRMSESRRPVLWALGSLVVRLTVLLVGIYLITGGHWIKIGVCMLGFFIMRLILVQHWQPRISQPIKEGIRRGNQS